MKRLIFISSMLFMASLAIAQPEKGDKMIAGNISAYYSDSKAGIYKGPKRGWIMLEPLVGVCLGKGYIIGGGVTYTFDSYTNHTIAPPISKYDRMQTHMVGPVIFSRHYSRIADKFYMRSGTNIGYYVNLNRYKNFDTGFEEATTGHRVDIRVRFGLVFFPKPNIGLEFSYGEIGYSADFANLLKNNNTERVSNDFNFKYGVDGIQVGLVYLIKPKAKKTAEEEMKK